MDNNIPTTGLENIINTGDTGNDIPAPNNIPTTGLESLNGISQNTPVDSKQTAMDNSAFINAMRTVNSMGLNRQQVKDPMASPFKEDDASKFTPVKYEVSASEVMNTLSDGSYVPKFDNYISGTNNEERLAQQQSGASQILNGIVKNTGKMATYVLDGTIGTIYGIAHGISTGSFNAVFNNEFSDWVDDTGKQLDSSLSNYYTEDEKNMSFLESMGTANFLANDVLGGMAFVGGVIGSEMLWAAATLGASVTLTPAKMAARAGGRALFKAGLKSSGKKLLKQGIKESAPSLVAQGLQRSKSYENLTGFMRKHLNGVQTGKIGTAANNLRFMYTSAGFEAGVEARHMFNESVDEYIDDYYNVHGEMPSGKTLAEFTELAKERSNNVFAANVALVGASNVAQFGRIFNVGTKLHRSAGRLGKRVLGLDYKTVSTAAGNVRQLRKATKLQKGVGNLYKYSETAIQEGVIEEGLQAVISGANANYLKAQYDPIAFQANYSVMDGVKDAFAHTYGTEEGRKEIYMGMLIGKITGLATGGRSLNPMKQAREGAQANVDAYNAAITPDNLGLRAVEFSPKTGQPLTVAQKRTIANMQNSNRHNALMAQTEVAMENGDALVASISFHQAAYSKMQIDEMMGGNGQALEDIKSVINSLTASQIQGFHPDANEADLAAFKEAAIKTAELDYQNYKKTKEATANINWDRLYKQNDIDKASRAGFKAEIELSMFTGVALNGQLENLGKTIDAYIGTQGTGKALGIYGRLNNNTRGRLKTINKKKAEIAELSDEFLAIQSSILAAEGANLDAEGKNTQMEALVTKRAKMQATLQTKEQELLDMRNQLANKMDRRSVYTAADLFLNQEEEDMPSADELETTMGELEKLENLVLTLEKGNENDKNTAKELKQLIADYVEHMAVSEGFIENSNKLMKAGQYRGVQQLFRHLNDELTDEALDRDFVQFLQGGSFLGDEEFSLRMFQMMAQKVRNLGAGGSLARLLTGASNMEPVSRDEYNAFKVDGIITDSTKQRIVDKLIIGGVELSTREQEMYDGNLEMFEEMKSEQIANNGDGLGALLAKTIKPVPPAAPNTPLSRIAEKLNKLQEASNTINDIDLDNIREEDVPIKEDFDRYEQLVKEHRELSEELRVNAKLTPTKRAKLNKELDALNTELEELSTTLNEWGRIQGVTGGSETVADLIMAKITLESVPEVSPEVVHSPSNPEVQQSVGTRDKKAKTEVVEEIDEDTTDEEYKEIIAELQRKADIEINKINYEIAITKEKMQDDKLSQEEKDSLGKLIDSKIEEKKQILKEVEIASMNAIQQRTGEQTTDNKEGKTNPLKIANLGMAQTYDTGIVSKTGSFAKGTAQLEIANVTLEGLKDAIGEKAITDIQGDKLVITVGNKRLVLTLEERGRIRFKHTPENIAIFNASGLMYAPFSKDSKKGYKVLLRKVGNEYVPLQSDFTISTNDIMDIDAAYGLEAGDEVKLVVDTNDEYNSEHLGKDSTIPDNAETRKLATKLEDKAQTLKAQIGTENLDKILANKGIIITALGSREDYINAIDSVIKMEFDEKVGQLAGVKVNDNTHLSDTLVVYVVNGNNQVVGVLKDSSAEGNRLTKKDEAAQTQLKAIRSNALKAIAGKTGVVDLNISIPVSKVYAGHPNYNVRDVGGEVTFENIKIEKQSYDKIEDVGYFENGQFYPRSSKTYNTGNVDYSFTEEFTKDKYQGKVIPMAVIVQGGKRIVYPIGVSASEVDVDVEAQVDDILLEDSNSSDKTRKLYNMMSERGLNSNSPEYGISPTDFVEGMLPEVIVDKVKAVLTDTPILSTNPIDWVKNNMRLEDILPNVEFDLNINDRTFISPKIKLDMKGVSGLSTPSSKPSVVSTVKGSTKNDVDNLKNKKC